MNAFQKAVLAGCSSSEPREKPAESVGSAREALGYKVVHTFQGGATCATPTH